VSAFRLIEAERANYPVAVLCAGCSKSPRAATLRLEIQTALQQEPRGLRPHTEDPRGSPQEPRDLRLPGGARRALRALGVRCGRRRVARLMRVAGLQGCMRSKKRKTTRRDPRTAPAPDLLRREFVAARPNKLWLADITYIPTQEGFLYLAFILDAHSR
jgi:putative transposase